MLIDSNIIIYAAQPQHAALRQWIAQHAPAVSAISYVEVLGYHRLALAEKQALELFFAAATMLPLSQPILAEAVKLRQQRKMTVGDALIAATCLLHKLTLVTHNTKDFTWIAGLTVFDPLASSTGMTT
jgi:predicted nucleic acid-binding protein